MKKLKNNLKFVISGYYGHENFGDEAILQSIVSGLKTNFENPHITVISNTPEKTKSLYGVNSVHKYNFLSLLRGIYSCDVFISGGGSLLQDVTSFKSLLYYLGLLWTAQIFNKKTCVYAQGIGPLKSRVSKFLTASILKKTDLITVRDKKSSEILSSMGIGATVTADPVWSLETKPVEKTGAKIGIQLRNWPTLNEIALNTITEAIVSNFKNTGTQIYLISLQHPADTKIMEKFQIILEQKGFSRQTKLVYNLDAEEIISCISSLDLMVSMRYHGGLIAAKCGVPSLMIAYDPKVIQLAKEISVPCIAMSELTFDPLNRGLKHLVSEKDNIKAHLHEISSEKLKTAEKNISLLLELLNK